jgi:hypothetical protein
MESEGMKIVVKQLQPGVWVIQRLSSVGASAGRTTYPSKEAAVAEAKRQSPGVEIEVQE